MPQRHLMPSEVAFLWALYLRVGVSCVQLSGAYMEGWRNERMNEQMHDHFGDAKTRTYL